MLKLCISLWCACVAFNVWAHPQHASLAEINLSADESQLQVALKLIPEDLEASLSTIHQRTVVLIDDEKVDTLLMEYLWQRFRVFDQDQQQLAINWLGKEVSYGGAWLYFTVSINNAKKLVLENKVLFEQQPTQLNHVAFDYKEKTDLIFTVKHKKQLLFER